MTAEDQLERVANLINTQRGKAFELRYKKINSKGLGRRRPRARRCGRTAIRWTQ